MSINDCFRGYREDEEMYVYDQCCGNCANNEDGRCPLKPKKRDEDLEPSRRNAEGRTREERTIERKRREDGVFREGELEWCIYWKQRKGRYR